MNYLKAIAISLFDLFGDELAVALGRKTLEAH
jgi:hypothetical protein